jgi:hypothetical protein
MEREAELRELVYGSSRKGGGSHKKHQEDKIERIQVPGPSSRPQKQPRFESAQDTVGEPSLVHTHNGPLHGAALGELVCTFAKVPPLFVYVLRMSAEQDQLFLTLTLTLTLTRLSLLSLLSPHALAATPLRPSADLCPCGRAHENNRRSG